MKKLICLVYLFCGLLTTGNCFANSDYKDYPATHYMNLSMPTVNSSHISQNFAIPESNLLELKLTLRSLSKLTLDRHELITINLLDHHGKFKQQIFKYEYTPKNNDINENSVNNICVNIDTGEDDQIQIKNDDLGIEQGLAGSLAETITLTFLR